MQNKLQIIFIISIFLIVGCGSGDGTTSSNQELTEINLTATYFDYSNDMILNDAVEPGTRLTFPFISGNIFGTVSNEILLDVTIDVNNQAVITLNESIFTSMTEPEIISIEAANYGLSIEPADARFGRLGTFAITSGGQSVAADGYGLYDGATNSYFMIVYFDRPARLTGTYTEGSNTVNVDINVSSAGFYAVKSSEELASNMRTVNYNEVISLSDDLYFIILPVGSVQPVLSMPLLDGMNTNLCIAPICGIK